MQEPSAKRLGILFLTTTGRKSGEKRTVPTFFMRDGDALIVVPSNAGDPRDPAWYLNLQANPEAEIQRPGGGTQLVRAHTASAEERARLWPELVRLNPGFTRYEKRRTSQIPVVVLELAL